MNLSDQPGAAVFAKTISESDIYLFAGITGDMNAVHIDETQAVSAGLPGRIAHGVLVLGMMSTVSTLYAQSKGFRFLSYGWEGVRFIAPVLVGDTITVAYLAADEPALPSGKGWKLTALSEARNQKDELVAIGRNIIYLLDPPVT